MIDTFMTRFKSPRNQRGYMGELQAFLDQRNVPLLHATWNDILAFLQSVDERNILVQTKERRRRICYQFYKFVKVRVKARDDIPVPDQDEYQFTEKDRTGEVPAVPLDAATARRVLDYMHHADLVLYTGTRALFETGMRVLELVNIERPNVDLGKRMIVTRGKTGWVRYFFPPSFAIELETFITYQEQVHGRENVFLFPNVLRASNKRSNVTTKFFRSNLQAIAGKLNITRAVHPHAWRDLINTARADKFKLHGERDSLLAILLCQVPAGVNARHYLKKYDWKNPATWEAHRDLYDELYPW